MFSLTSYPLHYCHFMLIRYNTFGINKGASVFVPEFVPILTYIPIKLSNLLN